MKRLAIAAFFVALGAPAWAHDDRAPLGPSILDGIVQERDVGLVFGYLREALDAAMEGREAAPPAELAQRANEIGGEMQRRGAVAARAFIDSIEKSVREGLRDRPPAPALPPSSRRI